MAREKQSRGRPTAPAAPVLVQLGCRKLPKRRGEPSDEDWVDTATLAEMLGVTRAFLNKRRCREGGPPFRKSLGHVTYRVGAVKAWLASLSVTSASQNGEAA
jgi:hypothetical protein